MNIGDRVKINDYQNVYTGKIHGRWGTVSDIDHSDVFPYGVKVDGIDMVLFFRLDELVNGDELAELRAENARLAAELTDATERAQEARNLIRDIGNGQAGFAYCQYCNGVQVIKQYNCGDDGPCFECANCGGGHDGWTPELKVDNAQLFEEGDDIPF